MKVFRQMLTAIVAMGCSIAAMATQPTDDSDATSVVNVDSLPIVSVYYFENQYLSIVAPQVELSNSSIFADAEILNTLMPMELGFISPFKDEDIDIEQFEVDGKIVYIWKFPEPKYQEESLYMAFVPNGDVYKAYGISIGRTVDWQISTSYDYGFSSSGRVKRPDSARECLDLLIERGAMTGTITPGDFLQEGYVTPPYSWNAE